MTVNSVSSSSASTAMDFSAMASKSGKSTSSSSSSGTSATGTSSDEDVSTLSDSELKSLAGDGDLEAIRELQKREAAKAEKTTSGGSADPAKASAPREDKGDIGNKVDAYA
jgi:hypothetical protein